MEELVFVHVADEEFIQQLKKEEEICATGINTLTHEYMRTFDPPEARLELLRNLQRVLGLELRLASHSAVTGGGWRIPRFRWVVLNRDLVPWEGTLYQRWKVQRASRLTRK